MVELITDLTPGGDLRLLFLDEPGVADWHEPLRYRYSALFRGDRPASVRASDLASRAARLLGLAGWEVAVGEERDGGKRWSVLTGRHDGSSVEIRVGHHTSAVMFSGRTAAMPLHTLEAFQWPEPVCTAESVTPGYVLCYECDGLGACPGCGGRGWVPEPTHGRTKCRECHGARFCLICRGGGELAISQLSEYQRGNYPELG
ncbi:hypothetical protein [Kitasatospora sp. NBC_01266]|uniref:hypothetical protein n=1 Tax=Kitasatospora sp. NBC_01266 TaxID=2903572 RepID=UPI002E2F8524|nr:hypothetical protein [Kitasatospora sp. NBC_01266]